jgi:multicomponent Na+:H+ antiporter subunit E
VIIVLAATAVYLLTLGSLHPADIALGLLVSGALVLLLRGRLPTPGGPPGRWWGLPRLVAAVIADITRGTWDVALRVLHLRSFDTPGIVTVPYGERSPRGVAVTGLLVGLSPGSMLLDVDHERGVMLFHVVDASRPDAVRAQIDNFYDRYQRKVWP